VLLIIHFAVVALFCLLGVLFLQGKGAFLIAGYNTSSPKEKKSYDEKALCRFMGKFMFALAACWGVLASSEIFKTMILFWVGFGLFLAVTFWGVIYANTGNRFRK